MKNKLKQFSNIFRKTVLKRRAFFLISDILLVSFAMYSSFWLRFNGAIPSNYNKTILYYVFISLFIKLCVMIPFNLYDISWRYVSIEEVIKLVKAISLGSIILGMLLYFLRTTFPFRAAPFPRSVLLVDYIFSIILIGGLRISKRILLEGIQSTLKMKKNPTKLLIIGAGSAGEQIIREIFRSEKDNYIPIGIVDDDPAKKGIKLHGIRVMGNRNTIPEIVKTQEVDEILLALPSAPSKEIREIVQIIRKTKIAENIKILPSTIDMITGVATLSDIHEINLNDLLGRAPVNIDYKAIGAFIQNKKVLITGAGGSIGSEIAKLVHQFNPKTLIILDIDETELYYLYNQLKPAKTKITPVICDIKDVAKLELIFEDHSPQIVLHAAAYKHVPILEFYPEEAVKTNIFGTKVVAQASIQYNAEKFIFISTDKAINPSSVMGATKRASEELLRVFNMENKTKFISVRFGNVLGSRGSVIPIFREQIKKGGPVTVTHPEMKRYFMVLSEAALLVLEAAATGDGGEVYILDMGEQVKITDLAKEMIKLSTLPQEKDIPIVFTQIRPGEKLSEEIFSAEEGVESTKYEKLLKVKYGNKRVDNVLLEKINHLIKISNERDNDNLKKLLGEIVPTYRPFENEAQKIFW